ncbi:hypothetical protein [Streptomyces lonarensis]|uniref:Uncharacterized protein n=1 Tax=Streptomyces lonarensis TaxID=700599 RepID=A0A7X6HX62_9ACTN|nr:hypothetical protein [Streptomyces lonarensis]NJQ04276.1 hypothetical protein [Streptomyces lonarensis]
MAKFKGTNGAIVETSENRRGWISKCSCGWSSQQANQREAISAANSHAGSCRALR